jgi:hypothetical protein
VASGARHRFRTAFDFGSSASSNSRLNHLKAGDEVNVEVHAGGTITLMPLRPRPAPAEISKAIKSTMKDYARTMKKLA